MGLLAVGAHRGAAVTGGAPDKSAGSNSADLLQSLTRSSRAGVQPYLSREVLVCGQVLCSDAVKGGQVFGGAAIQGLQVQVEVFVASYILKIHDVLAVLCPAELPAQNLSCFACLLGCCDLFASGLAAVAAWHDTFCNAVKQGSLCIGSGRDDKPVESEDCCTEQWDWHAA